MAARSRTHDAHGAHVISFSSISSRTTGAVVRIGFIGAGTVAQAIAAHATLAGHQVLLSNSRGPETLRDLALGLGASAGTPQEAATADLVVLAVPWPLVRPALAQVPDWSGRILIDATNQFADGKGIPDDLGDETGSEVVARHARGASVVKAFNTLYGSELVADPRRTGGRMLLFYSGDHAYANQRLDDFAASIGFAAVRIGGLRDGGRLMQIGGPLSGLHAVRLA
jgi:predicted dinucleotide-binding enzyme